MVRVLDVIDGMGMDEPFRCYYDRKTDQVVWSALDELEAAEESNDDDELADIAGKTENGNEDSIKIALDIVKDDGAEYVPLPTQWDIDEYSIMADFAAGLRDSQMKDRIWRGLQGTEAFRRFKQNIQRYEVADEWYQFRDERLHEIASEWADENSVPIDMSEESTELPTAS